MEMLTESIQGLEKGLEVLAFLNTHNNVSVAEVVRATRLPRTTALRVLETLRLNGYIERAARKRYRLTIKVRSLADGYDDASWISDIAKPHLRRLTRALVWPTMIATPAGPTMIWRETTDGESPMVTNRYVVGQRIPVLASATGRIYLAFCSDEERRTTLEVALTSAKLRDDLPAKPHTAIRLLQGIREKGFVLVPYRQEKETAIAVPVLVQGRYIASLGLRFIYGVMTDAEAARRYLQPLQTCAKQIATDYAKRVVEVIGGEIG